MLSSRAADTMDGINVGKESLQTKLMQNIFIVDYFDYSLQISVYKYASSREVNMK